MDSVRAHLGGSASQHYELPILSKFGTLRFLDVSTRIIYRKVIPSRYRASDAISPTEARRRTIVRVRAAIAAQERRT